MIHHRRMRRRHFETAGALAVALEKYFPAMLDIAPAEPLEIGFRLLLLEER
jgi:hypothetical protein